MPEPAEDRRKDVEIRFTIPAVAADHFEEKAGQHFMRRNTYIQRLVIDHYRRQEINGNTR